MSKPNVLVTGGAGYIGSHAVLALQDAGWTVAVIDDLSTGFRQFVNPAAELCEVNLLDFAKIRPLFAGAAKDGGACRP